MKLTTWDFDRLTVTHTTWGKSWEWQLDRFEQMTPGTKYDAPISLDWGHAYWVDNVGSDIVLARHFLEQEGWSYEILWDLADQRSDASRAEYAKAGISTGYIFNYVILTNYSVDRDERTD